METTMIERAPDVETTNIFDKAICLSLTLKRLGVRRKVNVGELKPGVEFDPTAIGVSKELLESKELDAIARADKALRSYLEGKTSGPALFRTGVYMLSYDILAEVDRELRLRLLERSNVLVPAFVAAYEKARDEAPARLGSLWKAEDYPAPDTVAAAFQAETRYFSIGTPAKLAGISADIFEREKEKAAGQWASVIEESQRVLRAEFAELVEHLAERLQPDADGKTKRFNSSLVENLDEFLRTFNARNIGNDTELTAVIEQARAALAGVTPTKLRDSRFTRGIVRDTFTEIKATVDRLVETQGRRFEFDGE